MVFSSPIFLFVFLISVVVIYNFFLIFRNLYIQNFILLVFSIIFYAYGCYEFLPMLTVSLVVNYVSALLMKKYNKKKQRFPILAMTVGFDILVLFYYKYLNLFINLFIDIGNFVVNGHFEKNILDITLPIGISFYTFQIISYVVDVYKKKVKANKNFFDVALYALFFPQLIAGPIVRYSDIQFRLNLREHSFDNLYFGFKRFAIGFIKKILFANAMGEIADIVFASNGGVFGFRLGMFGAICFSFQIYLDFSAYSDMAIGLAKIFAFDFKENFNYPFISCGMREMWERWHISLSSFFRDYVYIPLGGSRKGLWIRCRNLLIVFMFSGFWHGANWNYLLWGLYNAFFVIVDTLIILFFSNLRKKFETIDNLYLFLQNPFIRFINIMITFIIWIFGMVIFRCESLDVFINFIKTLTSPMQFDIITREIYKKVFNGYFLIILIGTICYCFRIFKFIEEKIEYTFLIVVEDIIIFILFVYAIIEMISSGFNPFIYFRF